MLVATTPRDAATPTRDAAPTALRSRHPHHLAARPGPRRRRRLPRSRQRRQQHDRRAPATATCWSGSSCSATSWPGSSSTSRPSSASSPARACPQVLGDRIRVARRRIAYWLQAELVAMATDLAEVIGGAVALNLLFGLPLLLGGVITGHRLAWSCSPCRAGAARAPSSSSSSGCSSIIAIGFSVGVFVAPPDAGERRWAASFPASRTPARCCSPRRSSAPRSCRTRSTRTRRSPATASARQHAGRGRDQPRKRLLTATRWDVSIAMVIAGTVNLCHPAARRREPRRASPGTDTPRGRVRRHRRRRSARSSPPCSRSACSPPASPRPRSAPTRAPRSCTACCTCASRSLAASPRHADPGARHARRRLRPDARARAQPGGALLRHPVRPDPARRGSPRAASVLGELAQPLGDDGGRRRRHPCCSSPSTACCSWLVFTVPEHVSG